MEMERRNGWQQGTSSPLQHSIFTQTQVKSVNLPDFNPLFGLLVHLIARLNIECLIPRINV